MKNLLDCRPWYARACDQIYTTFAGKGFWFTMVALIVFIFGAVAFITSWTVEEEQTFIRDHRCSLIGSTDGGWAWGMGKGVYTPGHDLYQCDDGQIHGFRKRSWW